MVVRIPDVDVLGLKNKTNHSDRNKFDGWWDRYKILIGCVYVIFINPKIGQLCRSSFLAGQLVAVTPLKFLVVISKHKKKESKKNDQKKRPKKSIRGNEPMETGGDGPK